MIAFIVSALPGEMCLGQVDEALPLPQWSDEATGTDADLGAQFNNLLPPPPDLRRWVETGPLLENGPPTILPQYSDLSPHDLALFLHGSILEPGQDSTAGVGPTPAVKLRDLPQNILLQTYQSGAQEYLIDPQTLVPEVARMDLARLLEFHGADSRIRLFLLVIDGDQKLPERVVLDSIAQGALTKLDACLAVYPLGEPWRARFLVSKSLHQAVPVQGLTELAEDCIHDAQRSADPAQQLQRFAIRLSTRLFWLEKDLPAGVVGQSSAPLHEVAQGSAAALAMAETAPRDGSAWLSVVRGIALLTLLGGGPALFFILRRRGRHHQFSHVWMLPDLDVPPRLGGNFSGGTSAVINFGPQAR
ncbi:MAG: hypothetical protein U0984_02560 [Prosthecobacter sp.]|nr:hypothetical protein [Prosthecobacter sp.]